MELCFSYVYLLLEIVGLPHIFRVIGLYSCWYITVQSALQHVRQSLASAEALHGCVMVDLGNVHIVAWLEFSLARVHILDGTDLH